MNHLKIHETAVQLAKNYLATEVELVEILQVVNREDVYRKLGYTSLFTYAVEALKLPRERVYQLNTVAKTCEKVPELKVAIESGVLNISDARRITSAIQKDPSQDWIQMAATLPQRELENAVAKVNPKEAVPEKVKVLNATEGFISCSIALEAQDKLKRLQDLLSQKEKRAISLREVIEKLADLGVEKLDPLVKARKWESKPDTNMSKERKPVRTATNTSSERQSATTGANTLAGRQPVPAAVRHQIQLRDNGRCTEVKDGKRCGSERWLEVHHIRPVAVGGGNELNNLTTLCSGHHNLRHSSP